MRNFFFASWEKYSSHHGLKMSSFRHKNKLQIKYYTGHVGATRTRVTKNCYLNHMAGTLSQCCKKYIIMTTWCDFPSSWGKKCDFYHIMQMLYTELKSDSAFSTWQIFTRHAAAYYTRFCHVLVVLNDDVMFP